MCCHHYYGQRGWSRRKLWLIFTAIAVLLTSYELWPSRVIQGSRGYIVQSRHAGLAVNMFSTPLSLLYRFDTGTWRAIDLW
jgi:hypothetical protein